MARNYTPILFFFKWHCFQSSQENTGHDFWGGGGLWDEPMGYPHGDLHACSSRWVFCEKGLPYPASPMSLWAYVPPSALYGWLWVVWWGQVVCWICSGQLWVQVSTQSWNLTGRSSTHHYFPSLPQRVGHGPLQPVQSLRAPFHSTSAG